MANELLDFVMGLVRDPDAAARYAADPAQAIADANLAEVTSADVNNLIPMVSDSLSMAAPAFGADPGFDQVIDSNVWTSGAATQAFDAFEPQTLTTPISDVGVIDTAAPEVAPVLAELQPTADGLLSGESGLISDVDVDALSAPEPALWDHSVTDPHALDRGDATFDLFD